MFTFYTIAPFICCFTTTLPYNSVVLVYNAVLLYNIIFAQPTYAQTYV